MVLPWGSSQYRIRSLIVRSRKVSKEMRSLLIFQLLWTLACVSVALLSRHLPYYRESVREWAHNTLLIYRLQTMCCTSGYFERKRPQYMDSGDIEYLLTYKPHLWMIEVFQKCNSSQWSSVMIWFVWCKSVCLKYMLYLSINCYINIYAIECNSYTYTQALRW